MYIFVIANTKRAQNVGPATRQMVLREAGDQRETPSHPLCPRSSVSLRDATITALHGTKELQSTKEALILPMAESVHSNKCIKVVHQWEIFKTPTHKSRHNHWWNTGGRVFEVWKDK